MERKSVDVTTAIMMEREAVIDAVNSSGLPASVSAMVVKEILELIQMKAQEEYQAAQKAREEASNSGVN